MIRISNEYSLECVGVAVYGQRYGGTIKLTSPEAFGMPYLDSRSIRSLFDSACFDRLHFLYRLILECAVMGLAVYASNNLSAEQIM